MGKVIQMKRLKFSSLNCVTLALALVCAGCNTEQAKETLNDAGVAMEEAGNDVAEKTGEMAEEGKKMAGDATEGAKKMAGDATEGAKKMAGQLSEKAYAFLTPLKEKVANLESLKDSPEKLKEAVSKLITSIEEKTESLQLPEKIDNGLATVKEKLVSLRDYLEGEYEQSKINEYVKDIGDTVQSELGMKAPKEG